MGSFSMILPREFSVFLDPTDSKFQNTTIFSTVAHNRTTEPSNNSLRLLSLSFESVGNELLNDFFDVARIRVEAEDIQAAY